MRQTAAAPYQFLVRIAPEVTTKARRTRRRFQARLAANIRSALRSAGIDAVVEGAWSRLLVSAADESAGRRIASVFGVSSVSRIDARVPADLDEIVRVGTTLYSDLVRGRSFAVRARRAGPLPFATQDVRVRLGAALNREATVDLDHPDVTVSVELRDGEAFLFSGRHAGVGGLPLGVEGKAVCLLSGGFDSAVAAWLMLKRGVALEYVFCNLGGEAYERSVVSVAKILADVWSYGDRPLIHVIDFAEPLGAIKRGVTPRYWQVVLKRLMYRAAEQVGRAVGADAIITGESVGQVSSQTLGNLRAIDAIATLPVLRPLIGWDKADIIRRAEAIGTAVVSATVREYCAIVPDRPVTNARTAAVDAEERALEAVTLETAVAARRTIDLRALEAVDLVQPYLFTREIADHAVVIDCRERHQYRAWHYPGADQRDLLELAAHFRELDKTRTYVLYCAFGVQSAHVAEVMQRAGYEAYSFHGGLRQLMRYAQSRGHSVTLP